MRLVEVDAAVVSIYPQDLSLTWGSVAVMRAAARARIPRQTNTTVRQQVQASHGASLAPPGSYKSTKLCCVIQAVCWLLCFRRVPHVAMGRLYVTGYLILRSILNGAGAARRYDGSGFDMGHHHATFTPHAASAGRCKLPGFCLQFIFVSCIFYI